MWKTTLIFLLFQFLSINAFCQNGFYERLSNSALELTMQNVVYDPGYYKISYPNGDIPANKGALSFYICT